MSVYALILRESPVRLWGLSSRQRLERVLKRAGLAERVDDLASVPAQSTVLLIRGDYLYDDRVVKALVETPNAVLQVRGTQKPTVVAAHVSSELAAQMRDTLDGAAAAKPLSDVRFETPETLTSSYQQRLRKFDPPFVLPINPANHRELEQRLFSWSYKGVTDLVTKWIWPRPAQWATGLCVRSGLRPNHVTLLSLILVVLAGFLFAYGLYGWGLLTGWLMTFLDTVDGKLARVTVTSSRFGNVFDHLIDLIYPPLWYIAWGVGLGASFPGVLGLSVSTMLWFIVVGYVVGRLAEGSFNLWLGKFGIFSWRPVDSYFRLITARRNPNLILLTVGTTLNRPDLALAAVAFWTVATSLFLLVRLAVAVRTRISHGPLQPWFLNIDQKADSRSLAVKLFTRQATP